jgi:hypothetical protein
MKKIDNNAYKLSFDALGGLIGGFGIYRVAFGRKIIREIDGKHIQYYVLPITGKEMKDKMFNTPFTKHEFNWKNNYKYIHRRAPFYCMLFSFSLIHSAYLCTNNK